LTLFERSKKMGPRKVIVRRVRRSLPGVGILNLRAEIIRTTTRAAASACAGEFNGGIWFKIFSERGPSRLVPTP
jgi:hypothetical protein